MLAGGKGTTALLLSDGSCLLRNFVVVSNKIARVFKLSVFDFIVEKKRKHMIVIPSDSFLNRYMKTIETVISFDFFCLRSSGGTPSDAFEKIVTSKQ